MTINFICLLSQVIYFIYLPENQYGVETQIIQIDFSLGEALYEKIADEIKGKEVGILGKTCFFKCFYLFYIDADNWSLRVTNLH